MKQAEEMNDSALIQILADYKAAFVKHPKVIFSQRAPA